MALTHLLATEMKKEANALDIVLSCTQYHLTKCHLMTLIFLLILSLSLDHSAHVVMRRLSIFVMPTQLPMSDDYDVSL